MVAKSDRIAQLQSILIATEGKSSGEVQLRLAEAAAMRERHEAEARQWEREKKALRDEAAELRAFKGQKAQLESELLALKAEVGCAPPLPHGHHRRAIGHGEWARLYSCGPALLLFSRPGPHNWGTRRTRLPAQRCGRSRGPCAASGPAAPARRTGWAVGRRGRCRGRVRWPWRGPARDGRREVAGRS